MSKRARPVAILKVRKGARLPEIYKRVREEFTAADLQKYTIVEEGVPARQVLAELEKLERAATKKRAGRKKRKA